MSKSLAPAHVERELKREKRRLEVAELWLMGYTFRAIASKLQVSWVTVERDVEAVKGVWKTSRLEYDELRDKELARLDKIDREAWDAWELSKVDHEGNRRPGDVRFLQMVASTIAQRRELLGLDTETTRREESNVTITFDDRKARFAEIIDALSVRTGIEESATRLSAALSGDVRNGDEPRALENEPASRPD